LTDQRRTILHIIPSLQQGGAERILSDVVTQMVGDHHHHIVTLLDEPPFFDLGNADLTTLRMDRTRWDIGAARRLMKVADQVRPSLIHTWMYHANVLSTVLHSRAPILWSIHNTDLSPSGTRLRTRLINRAGAGLSQFVPSLVAYCSQSAKDIHEAIGYAVRKGRLIENGVDTAALFRDERLRRDSRRALGLAGDQFVACSLARFSPQKDHSTMLAAIAQARTKIPQLRVLLVGSGCDSSNPALREMVQQFGLAGAVLMLGERHDINAILNASDVLVVSSAFGEALPLAILEASAVGLPVISTAAGNVAELGLVDTIVPIRDPARLAEAIGAAALQPHVPASAAARRHLVETRFSTDRMLSAYAATYRELLGRL
jgi:glycosyltransferase involved in cell wall biosynthesis